MAEKIDDRRYDLTQKYTLSKRLIYQVVRFVLVALFFYIAYLGIVMRVDPNSAQKAKPPPASSPSRPAPSPAAPPSR